MQKEKLTIRLQSMVPASVFFVATFMPSGYVRNEK